jgi:RNA polymerase sigma-B factor
MTIPQQHPPRLSSGSGSTDAEAEALFRQYARRKDEHVRERLVAMHQNLVRFLAGKFANRGEPLEDLVQVGTIGLINAVDRYDAERGTKFSTYATPTIVGEIRRYFRDKAWSLKVPRRLQELNQAANKAVDTLSVRLGRSPTIAEIAQAIGANEEETLEAMELGNAYDTVSLDSRMSTESESAPMTLAEFVGGEDENLNALQRYGDLTAALDSLDEREQVIITLRFFKDMSQAEVAKRLNISQMHVSRLQHRALSNLKKAMLSG